MFLYQNLTGEVRMYTNRIYKLVHVSILYVYVMFCVGIGTCKFMGIISSILSTIHEWL